MRSCVVNCRSPHYGDPPSTVSKDLCCSNCNPAIFTDCEYDIRTSHSADIAKTRREPMLSNIQKWFTRWAEARYQDTLWTPTVNCVIPDKQLCRLYNIGWVPDVASLKQAMPEWDPDILGKELPSFIKFLADEERKQKQEEIGQLSGPSGLIMQMSKRFSQALEQHAAADERLSQALIRASQVSDRRFEISAPWQSAPRYGADISQAMPSPTLRSPAPTPPLLPLYQPSDTSMPPATCQLDTSLLVPQRRSARLNKGKRMRRALQEINGNAN